MSQKTTYRVLSTALATSAVGVLLAGCVSTPAEGESTPVAPSASTPAPSGTPSSSSDSVSTDAAVSTVTAYLTAVQREDHAAAYALLSDAAQAAIGSEQQFAGAGSAGIVRADEAAGYLGANGTIDAVAGPAQGSVLVTAVAGRRADAWLVRPSAGGARIDDAGVPSTGKSPYAWVNPASGPDDVRDAAAFDAQSPASLVFTRAEEGSDESIVGYPEELTAYLGTEEVAASPASSELQRAWDIPVEASQLSAGTEPLTVVWRVGGDTDLWRTSTTALYLS